MAADPRRTSQLLSIAALQGWAETHDRTARTAPGHRSSPLHKDWHEARIRAEGKVREEDIPAAADSAWRAYQRTQSLKGVEARRAKRTTPPRSSERRSA